MNLLSLDVGRIFVMGNSLSLGLQAGRASAGRGAAPKSNCLALAKPSWVRAGHQAGDNPCVRCEIWDLQGQVLLGGFPGVHAGVSVWSLALTLPWSKEDIPTLHGNPQSTAQLF